MPFETFLKTRIFEPLGMKDTGFSVRVEDANRYSKVYEFGEDGELQAIEKIHAATGPLSFFHSGGGGLQSTAADYLRFCQMVLNDGELDGVRLLGRKTVELITIDHISNDWQPKRGLGQVLDLGSLLSPMSLKRTRSVPWALAVGAVWQAPHFGSIL